eukprot:IDg14311t1
MLLYFTNLLSSVTGCNLVQSYAPPISHAPLHSGKGRRALGTVLCYTELRFARRKQAAFVPFRTGSFYYFTQPVIPVAVEFIPMKHFSARDVESAARDVRASVRDALTAPHLITTACCTSALAVPLARQSHLHAFDMGLASRRLKRTVGHHRTGKRS